LVVFCLVVVVGGLLSTTSSWALFFGLWFVFGCFWRLRFGCAGCGKLLFFVGMFIGCGCVSCFGLASWCVAFGPRFVKGLRKLRPRVELQSPSKGQGESLGNGAETIRPPGLGDETLVMSSVLGWNGETAVLQVERANRR